MSKWDNSYLNKPKPLGRFLLLLLLLLVLVNFFFNFVLVPLQVRSNSMRPEISAGRKLIYSPLPVKWGGGSSLKRGDVVVLVPPYLTPAGFGRQLRNAILRLITFNGVDINQEKRKYLNPYMVRRVVAVPGDAVKVAGFVALVKRQGEPYFVSEFESAGTDYQLVLNEEMNDWPQGFPASGRMAEVTLAEGEYFVMSDNRYQGNDSRHWGSVSRKRILGKVLWRY